MGKVQVTDYETVERTIEQYECDQCGHIVDEEDINTALMSTGDCNAGISGSTADEVRYLCEDCTGLQSALSVREKEEYLRARWDGFRGKINFYIPILVGVTMGAMGVGMSWLMANDAIRQDYSLLGQVLGAAVTYWFSVAMGMLAILLILILMDL